MIKNTAYGNIFFYEGRTKCPSKYPYSYDPFFIQGNHCAINGSECSYSDRMEEWDRKKYKIALKALNGTNIEYASPDKLQKFIEIYFGEEYKFTGLVKWVNLATGYPLYTFHYKKHD